MTNVIKHVAFIMDGNRRWGKANNVNIVNSYTVGANKLEEVIKLLPTYNIKFATFFAFSSENWSRDNSEIIYLKKLLINFLDTNKNTFLEHKIKFVCIGDYKEFGNEIYNKITNLEETTKNFNYLTVCIALNYSSKIEIVNTINSIIKNKNTISVEDIEQNLLTANFPSVDLVIRTGGHKRLSNFLLWQAAYSELYFIEKMWPDFNKQDLETILDQFKHIQRNYGK